MAKSDPPLHKSRKRGVSLSKHGNTNQQASGGGTAIPFASPPVQRWQDQSRGKRKPIYKRPRRQGDGDGLCGLYAVINALRLAYEPEGGLSTLQERDIWASLVRYADRKWRFAQLFLGGTHSYQFLGLARYGAKLAHRKTGTKVVLKQVFRVELDRQQAALGKVIRYMEEKGCRAILAGLESQHFSHWTVVAGVTTATLKVLDSGGYHFLKLSSCQLDLKPRPRGSPRYWVKIYGGFALDERAITSKATPRKSRRNASSSPKLNNRKDLR